MSSESLIAHVNGEYVARDQARISVFDVGFLRGDAVFDTTSTWNGRIFKHGFYWALRESGRDGTPIFPESVG